MYNIVSARYLKSTRKVLSRFIDEVTYYASTTTTFNTLKQCQHALLSQN